jgi:hypothetical protein
MVMFVAMAMTLIVLCMSDALNMGSEASLLVRRVLDDSLRAIGLVQGVFALDLVAIAVLPLSMVVLGVWIVHAIFVFVRWMMMVVDMMIVVSTTVTTVAAILMTSMTAVMNLSVLAVVVGSLHVARAMSMG